MFLCTTDSSKFIKQLFNPFNCPPCYFDFYRIVRRLKTYHNELNTVCMIESLCTFGGHVRAKATQVVFVRTDIVIRKLICSHILILDKTKDKPHECNGCFLVHTAWLHVSLGRNSRRSASQRCLSRHRQRRIRVGFNWA